MTKSNLRMLIVDDEEDICEVLGDYFRKKGFKVRAAFSGEQAIDSIRDVPPDVMLLDIMLPGVTGLEVLRKVKELHPRTRVVMVTGLAQREIEQEARIFGAEGYVRKPFAFDATTWQAVFHPPIVK